MGSMTRIGFFNVESNTLFPLLRIGWTPGQLIGELEKYNVKNFRSKAQAIKNLSVVPLLCEIYKKEAIDEVSKATSLCDLPKLLLGLTKGKILSFDFEEEVFVTVPSAVLI